MTPQNAEVDSEDEDENFEMGQRTQKHDDLDWFSRLMRQSVDDSMNLLLQRLCHLIPQYELLLSQNNLKLVRTTER